MKLRNKKTGEVVKALEGGLIDLYFYPNEHDGENNLDRKTYQSLAELNANWEDYDQKEPLIKDEKIRKALRAVYDAAPHRDNVVYYDGRWTFRGDKFEVMFDDREIKIEGWTEGKAYHIEELCGEEGE